MCTSIVSNRNKTIIGWNLDITDMEHKVTVQDDKVYIAVNDKTEGWMPLFGANAYGDFVAMPTCWPYDNRSDPGGADCLNIIMLDIDLLLGKKSFDEIRRLVQSKPVYSVPGVTFQAQLSDSHGNVLQIVPGQGCNYLQKPVYSVMTNFSPFKGESEKHPWMGLDRYKEAARRLKDAKDDFDVRDCFEILKSTSQTVCPTVVSMVFDVGDNTVYWCENREWGSIKEKKLINNGGKT